MSSCPKILHFVWLGPIPSPEILIDTWRRLNPSWKVLVWRSAGDASPDGTSGRPWKLQAVMDGMHEIVGLVDLIRYQILDEFGGVAVDADSECVRSLDDGDFLRHEVWACYEN